MNWGEVGDTVQSRADSVALIIIFQEALFYYFFQVYIFFFAQFLVLRVLTPSYLNILTFLFQITVLSFQIWGGGDVELSVCWFVVFVDSPLWWIFILIFSSSEISVRIFCGSSYMGMSFQNSFAFTPTGNLMSLIGLELTFMLNAQFGISHTLCVMQL